jgi:protease-4
METTSGSPEFVPPPPPLAPPPVITPPGKPRKSRGWMVVAIILFVLLAFSLFGNLTQFIGSALSFHSGLPTEAFGPMRDAGPRLEEFVLENNKSANKIAVITVDGIITSHDYDSAGNNMVDVIKAQLDRAREDRRVKAVILKVDSPGGEVLASDEIYNAIRDFQEDEPAHDGHPARKGKPVICSMGSLAASGGYYIASGSRWIVANELTITGSIGVIMHGYNYRGLLNKVGVAPMTFKSGKYKDMLSGDREPSEISTEEKAMVQGLIDETFGRFKDVVADGRIAAHEANKSDGKALADNWEEFADGRVFSGIQAKSLGFVDENGNFDTAVDRAFEIAGISSANLIEYRERYDFANFLSLFGESGQAHDIKLNIGIEAPKLRPGLMYYLYLP